MKSLLHHVEKVSERGKRAFCWLEKSFFRKGFRYLLPQMSVRWVRVKKNPSYGLLE